MRLGNEAEVSQGVELEKGSTYSVTFSAARTCAQLETLNVSAAGAAATVDLQTLYSVEGWDAYAWAFQAQQEEGAEAKLAFKNPGMEDDPTCGPIIDSIAIKKLFTPDRPEGKVPGILALSDLFFLDLGISLCCDSWTTANYTCTVGTTWPRTTPPQ